jgi:hypothetical protein
MSPASMIAGFGTRSRGRHHPAQIPRNAVLLDVGDDVLDARRRAVADAAITLDRTIAAACP